MLPQKLKFLVLYNSFSAIERKHFSHFLDSAYPAFEPQLFRLFNLILNRPSQNEVNENDIWNQLYTASPRPYSGPHMRKLFSDLAKRAELFLTLEAVRSQPSEHLHLLLRELRNRNLSKYFSQHFNYFQKKFRKAERVHNSTDFLTSFEIGWEYYDYEIPNRRESENLDEIIQDLDHYYLLLQFKFLFEKRWISVVLASSADQKRMSTILNLARQEPYCKHPIIKIYLALHATLEMEIENYHPETLEALIQLLEDQSLSFEIDLAGYLFNFALNHVIQMINISTDEDQPYFADRCIQLFDFALANKFLHDQDVLPEFILKNYISLLLKQKQYGKAYEKIHSLGKEMSSVIRQNAMAFNLANYFVHTGQYEKSRVLLQKVRFEDHFYALDSRSLLMKSYIETQDWEPLSSFLDAFIRFLDRNRHLSRDRKTRHQNKVRILRSMVSVMLNSKHNKKEKLQELKEKAVNEPELIDRSYVIQQLDRYAANFT